MGIAGTFTAAGQVSGQMTVSGDYNPATGYPDSGSKRDVTLIVSGSGAFDSRVVVERMADYTSGAFIFMNRLDPGGGTMQLMLPTGSIWRLRMEGAPQTPVKYQMA